MPTREEHPFLRAIPIDIEGLYEKVDEPLPHSSKKWWWCWGGVVGLLFLVQAVTGLLLAFYYRAEPATAHQSIQYITENARYGWLIRSIHQWGATFMVIALFLHMLRVFVTGAYRDGRWTTWVVGVFLLGTTLGLAFTGYSLVYDQTSYWAVTVTGNILAQVPFIGGTLKKFFLAGDGINQATLSRMYALHAQVLPAALIVFGLLHLFFIRLLGMYLPGNEKDIQEERELTAKEGPYHFFPDHMLSELAVFLYVFLVILFLSMIFTAKMGAPADPTVTPAHIKPEWYFYPFYHLLKLVPGTIGVALMGIAAGALLFWPLLDRVLFSKIDRALKWRFETGILIGTVFLAFYLAWAYIEATGPSA